MKNQRPSTPSEWLSLLTSCADEADSISTHYFNKQDLTVIEKEDKSPVTQADQEIEQCIRTYILDKFPEVGVIGEEFESCDISTPIKLIIDPIDGTSNFIRKIPIYGTLLAIEVNKEIIAGLVSNGTTKERWDAALKQGARYNNEPINVSSVDNIKESQAFFGSLFGREARGNSQQLISLLSHTKRQRGIGDFLIHTWVASGYGEFGIDFNLQPWDIAPLGIIVSEAGGTVTQVDGSPFSIYNGSILSSNGLFHDNIVQLYKY
ncbi:hypothetical protein DID78_01550 [Candidatus Marinamargulisbacteria bacterium SCGC AG-343-D04]|nr:hypothetical protein DID78_01550 [Candidatus Marinamargulisbacteria bacterium SCGC AG-343-D04]